MAHLREDAIAEEFAGHVGDGAVGAGLNLGRDGQVARQPKVRHLGREAVRLFCAARQQDVPCKAHIANITLTPQHKTLVCGHVQCGAHLRIQGKWNKRVDPASESHQDSVNTATELLTITTRLT